MWTCSLRACATVSMNKSYHVAPQNIPIEIVKGKGSKFMAWIFQLILSITEQPLSPRERYSAQVGAMLFSK